MYLFHMTLVSIIPPMNESLWNQFHSERKGLPRVIPRWIPRQHVLKRYVRKVEKFQLPCLDLILSPSPSIDENSNHGRENLWKYGVWIRAPEGQFLFPFFLFFSNSSCTGYLWGDSNPRFSVIFAPMIWIFKEGEVEEIKSKHGSERNITLIGECAWRWSFRNHSIPMGNCWVKDHWKPVREKVIFFLFKE